MSAIISEPESLPRLSWIKERFVYSLIFLFPIAGVSVRHWFSAFFVTLVLVALWDLFRQWGSQSPLFKEEKIWLWLCAAFFASFMISALVNGWGHLQNRALGVDVRYLLVVPLFLMLRQYSRASCYLLSGILLAALVLAGQAYYDVSQLGLHRAQGFYSPNLLGPVAALMAIWVLTGWRHWRRLRWLLPLPVAAALYAVAMSGSRGAYLGLTAMSIVWAILYFRGWWRAVAAIVVLAVPLAGYYTSENVEQRVDTAIAEINSYVDNGTEGKQALDATAVRFEMWRAGWMVFMEAPLLGVGPSNYTAAVKRHVGEEGLHADVAYHGQVHNAYIEILMSRGVVGFVIFVGMLFYPLFYFMKTRSLSPETAVFGVVQIAGYVVFALTDASPFDKGNFVSIYLLCMSVFLSHHAAKIKQRSV